MLYTVNEIVREQLIEQGRSTLHKYEQLLPLAVRGARKLNLDVGGTVKTVMLTPTSYNTIIPPEDYYSYAQVGVCIGGIIYNLARNPNMCFPHMRNDCGVLQPEPFNQWGNDFDGYLGSVVGLDTGWVYWAYTSYNEFGEFTGRLYGQGSGTGVGFFNWNEEHREFVLSPNLAGHPIVLMYTTTGINNANILVPEEMIEPLISFVNWKSTKGSERAQMEAEFDKSVIQMRINKYSFTLDDMINAIRSNYSLAVKG